MLGLHQSKHLPHTVSDLFTWGPSVLCTDLWQDFGQVLTPTRLHVCELALQSSQKSSVQLRPPGCHQVIVQPTQFLTRQTYAILRLSGGLGRCSEPLNYNSSYPEAHLAAQDRSYGRKAHAQP